MDSTPSTPSTARLRPALARLIGSRIALVALCSVVVLAVAGSALGYQALSTTVTLTVDGQDREVRAMGGTVGQLPRGLQLAEIVERTTPVL